MYFEHFGLAAKPFGISPRLDFLYKSGAFEESMAHLVYGLDNSEAIVMLTGAIGTGKTMAIQSFLSRLGDRYVSALITNTSVDGKELLKLILDDLGSPAAAGADKSDLLIAFKNLTVGAGRQGKRIVIVIDEAQNLVREVLEEIRLLTNIGQGEEQPVQIILVGQPELETALQRPDLAQLKQRIRVHYKLEPLSRNELEEYVDHRMVVAGGEAGVFSRDALDRIYALSGGVPRVVNTLCGEALLSSYVAGRRRVEGNDLGEPAEPVEAVLPANPYAEPPRQEPTVRREAKIRPAPPARPDRSSSASRGVGSKTFRGQGVVLAALVIGALLVALVATGQLKPLWSHLPFAGSRAATAEPHVNSKTPDQTVSTPAMQPADSATAADSSKSVVAGDLVVPDREDTHVEALPAPVEATPFGTAEASEADDPATVVAPATGKPAETDGAYYIHVSSFRTAGHADTMARKFTDSGLIATVRKQMVHDSQWFRVCLGPFSTHDDAVRLANRLREEGTITYYKVTRLEAENGL